MHIRCPICDLSIQTLTPRKREEHCDACLTKGNASLGFAAATEELVLPNTKRAKTEDVKKSRAVRPPLTRIDTKQYSKQSANLLKEIQEVKENAAALKIENKFERHMDQSADATRNTKTSQGIISRPMPFYKTIMLGSVKVAVDAFKYGSIKGVTSFFLSHFHSDHYGGLSKAWTHGSIYCSPSTARLVKMKLRVLPEYIKPLELCTKYNIEGVDVVLLDANHCPGAVVFLFNGRVLHSGDFRATEQLINQVKQWTPSLDTVYLDTTYLDPLRKFPSQDIVVDVCAKYCQKFQAMPMPKSFFLANPKERRVLVVVGTYTIGKEKLAVAIANKLNKKIWCHANKRKVMEALNVTELDSLLCENGYEAQVHLVSMKDLSIAKLEQSWSHLKKHFTHIIAFVPTGWTWPSKSFEFTDRSLEDTKTSTIKNGGIIRICRVPYSEHSSFTELESFCKSIHCQRIVATVHTRRHDILKAWESI